MWLEEDCDWKVQNGSLDLMKIEVWCAEKPEGIQMYFPHDGDMKSQNEIFVNALMKKRQTGASAQGVCRVTRKKGCGGKNSKKKKHQ